MQNFFDVFGNFNHQLEFTPALLPFVDEELGTDSKYLLKLLDCEVALHRVLNHLSDFGVPIPNLVCAVLVHVQENVYLMEQVKQVAHVKRQLKLMVLMQFVLVAEGLLADD